MNIAEAKLRAVSWRNKVPTLDRTFELASRLGDPQNKLNVVHIAGTNGKGSCAAMTERILREAGYRTGLFTSPSLIDFNERLRINGRAVSEEELLKVTDEVMDQASRMDDEPTEFETTTVAMFKLFADCGCDIAVIETGMGGILDATNIVSKPLVTCIAQIGLDHTFILGDTIEKITREKAGIIKPGVPCVTEADEPDALKVIEEKCAETGSRLIIMDLGSLKEEGWDTDSQRFSYKELKDTKLSLLGDHQLRNAATVCEVIGVLREHGFDIGEEAVRKGFASVRWPARFQHVRSGLWVDGGHNPSGAETAAEAVKKHLGRVSLLYGTFSDKDWKQNIDILSEVADSIVLVPLNSPRSEDPVNVQRYLRETGRNAAVCLSIEDGLRSAAILGEIWGREVLAVGSLELAAEVLAAEGYDCNNV